MNATRRLLTQHYEPLIRFLGKRNVPKQLDHTPAAHPAAPTPTLPNSFAAYRQQAQQHGPLNTTLGTRHHGIGDTPGSELGPVEPGKGLYFDRSELPSRFEKLKWTKDEIEAVESGGASMFA